MSTQTQQAPSATSEEFADRLFTASLGALEMLSVYVGDRLGWYRSLVDDGPATSAELSARTGTHERYAREWLEQQAATGILEVVDGSTAADRTYRLPEGAAEVLTNEHSLAYLGPMPRFFAAVGVNLPHLLDAYRTGGGVGWAQFGEDARGAQADMNRPWYEHALPGALQGIDSLNKVLGRPGAQILDVGCGAGWSTVALARAYPDARIDGVDVDAPSIERATHHAHSEGVAHRVELRHIDGASIGTESTYDAVFAFECIHDMPRPVEVLSAMRRAVKPGGAVVIMDESTEEEFVAPAPPMEQFFYGVSMFVCLPDGMSSPPSVGTGTVLRRSTLEDYATQAGFSGVDVLPIEDFGFWRFYQLTH
jgi:SAM-dependent methyltransferase